jgi:hypothetical protein
VPTRSIPTAHERDTKRLFARLGLIGRKTGKPLSLGDLEVAMLILLALLLVFLFFGLGFAVHLLWIAAVLLFIFWIVGFALGRGANAGSRRFYRW